MESHNVIFSPFNSGVLILFLHQKKHPQGVPLAQEEGFEPPRPFGQTVFKTASL